MHLARWRYAGLDGVNRQERLDGLGGPPVDLHFIGGVIQADEHGTVYRISHQQPVEPSGSECGIVNPNLTRV